MPKVKISEYSATANSNTDVASINIDEGCAPSGINNAIRAIMGHLKDFQSGTNGDPFNGPVNGTLGATTASTANVTTLTTSSTVTHNGGTANGVAYLNGSKVLTTGSALVFDGTNLGVGTTNPSVASGLGIVVNGGAGQARIALKNTNSGDTAGDGFQLAIDTSSNAYIDQRENAALIFNTNNTYAARIDSSGNLLVGATSNTGSGATSGKQVLQFNGAAVNGLYVDDTRTSAGTDTGIIFGRGANVIGAIDTSLTSFRVRAIGDLVFAANSTDAARIDTSGNLLVGKTSSNNGTNGAQLSPTTQFFTNTNDYIALFNRKGTDGVSIYFQKDETNVGNISVTTSATAYNTSSDYRLKNTIAPMTGALAKVALLKPCTYKWNADGSDGQGFIAHELQEVCPDAVIGEKDAVNEDGSIKPQGIDTSFLVATLTAAIQEQSALITQLTVRITALEGA